MPTIVSISSSDNGQSFRKSNKNNNHVTRKNTNNISTKVILFNVVRKDMLVLNVTLEMLKFLMISWHGYLRVLVLTPKDLTKVRYPNYLVDLLVWIYYNYK